MSDLSIRHLLREHREVEKTLEELESLLEEQEHDPQWGESQREDFTWVVEALTNHLLHHVRKEEEVLFPALEAFLPRDTGPLAVLRGEHHDVHEMFRLLRRAGELRTQGNNKPEILEGMQHYGDALLQIVRDHIYKEDRVLFPMVARFLSPERDAHLLEHMEAIDRTKAPVSPPLAERPQITSWGRRAPMAFDKQDLIERLKLEIEVIERGGYHPSVREPRKAVRIFRDSVSCPNLGLLEKVEPCTHCFLVEFVPQALRDREDACHFIPLNERGDTVASLEAEGKHDKLQEELLKWLRATVARLEAEVAARP